MNQKFDYLKFRNNVSKLTKSADSIVNKIHDYFWDLRFDFNRDSGDPYIDIKKEENDFNEEILKDRLNSIENRIYFALDYLGLNSSLDKFKNDLKLEANSKLMGYASYIDIHYSPRLEFLKDYIDSIFIDKELDENNFSTDSFPMLERILKGTPKIILDRGIEPKNESEVQREVQKVLIHVFPDTLKEFTIPKVAKTYRPDFGIKSLNCVIEYKFVDSVEEAKKFCGELFEDVGAYEGYEDWKYFYAVIYMTKPFLTQDQVEQEFKIANIPNNWKPIVVYGVGGRKKK